MNELIFFHPRWIFVISEWQEVDYILRFLCCFGARKEHENMKLKRRKLQPFFCCCCCLLCFQFFVLFFLFGFVMFWFCFCFYERLIFANGNILTNSRVKKVIWSGSHSTKLYLAILVFLIHSDPAVRTWRYGVRIYAN